MNHFDAIHHPEERGHCMACRHWQAEGAGLLNAADTVGLCLQPEMTHFSIQVSGLSGCNRFDPVPADAALADSSP